MATAGADGRPTLGTRQKRAAEADSKGREGEEAGLTISAVKTGVKQIN